MDASATISRPIPQSPTGKRFAIPVTILTALALLLRLMAINRHSFWYDEAIAAQLSQASAFDLFTGVAKDNGNPALYWILLHFWQMLFGESEPALRSLSVVIGVASVPLIAALGRKVFSPCAGVLAAALLAISPLNIELSNEARCYALLHLLAIASMLLFFRWMERPNWKRGSVYALSVAAACHTHYFAFFIPIAQGLAVLASPNRKKLISLWISAMAIAALFWIGWLPNFWQQIHQPGNMTRMGGRWPAQFESTPVALVFGRTLAWRDSSIVILAAVTLAAIALVWIPAIKGLLNLKEPNRIALGAWLFAPIILPLILALTVTPLYHVRAASVGLPALLLLSAGGIASLSRRFSILILSILLILTSISLARYIAYPLKDDWRDAVPTVLADLRPDEPIIFDTFIEHDSFMYYAQRMHTIPPEMIGLTDAPGPAGEITGVDFVNAQRIDHDPKNYAPKIFARPGAWLILCVPAGTFEQYDALFTQHGYHLIQQAHVKRIDLYHYVRNADSQ